MTEYTWDYHNRLAKVTEKNSQGTVTQVVEYSYDVFDRRIGRKIDTSAPFDMANAVIERYVLDDIHNGLASADGGNVVLDFVDPDGSGAQADRDVEAVPVRRGRRSALRPGRSLQDARRRGPQPVAVGGSLSARSATWPSRTARSPLTTSMTPMATSRPATRPRPATSSRAGNSTRPPNSSTIAHGTTMPPWAGGSARIRWGLRRGMRMWRGM